ncbi:MAG TPA: MFS transporter [Acidimicrobiia bacterium]|nr:MFS transporter [Acidimicrobiia bacterium]
MKHLRGSIGYLFATRLVINTGYRFVFPFLPAISRGLGVSLEQAGLLVSARSLTGVATPLVVSVVGRGERRLRLVVGGSLLFAAGMAVTAAAGLYAGAIAGFILMGLGKPAFDAAAQAYIADRTPYERRARYLSIIEFTWAGGLLVGAPAVGVLIDRFGWESPFWVTAVLVGMGAVLAPMLLDPDARGRVARPGRLRITRSGVGVLAMTLLFSLAAETTIIVYGAWLEDEFALSLAALGIASTVIALGELAGEGVVMAFADRMGKRRMVAWGLAVSAVGYVALGALGGGLVPGLIALSLAFIAFEITIVATIPLATEVVPAARSRYLALLTVAISLGRAAGDAIGPALFEWRGLVANTTVSAVAGALSLIALLALTDPE